MTEMIRDLIRNLQDSDDRPRIGQDLTCKLCDGRGTFFGATDFNKSCNSYPLVRSNISVPYYRCNLCELIFTDFFDDWTSEDFHSLIYNEDYVKVDPDYVGTRAESTARMMNALLDAGKGELSLLDFGSGEGVFANKMQDYGFLDVSSYDPFSNPIELDRKYDVVTAFEVIEHSTDPFSTFQTLLNYTNEGGFIFIGQSMQPYNIAEIGVSWWYIAPRNGHVTFYSHQTIHDFAQREGLVYRSLGGDFILHRATVSPVAARVMANMPDAVRTIELKAPANDRLGGGEWHGIESLDGRAYRWTRNHEIDFGVFDIPSGGAFVQMPYLMAIQDAFAVNCSLKIGETLFSLRPRDGKLTAFVSPTLLPSSNDVRILLITPAATSPKSHGLNEDDRNIGLAVPV